MTGCCQFAGLWPVTPCAVGICTPNMPEVHHHHGWNAYDELITMHGPGAGPDEDWTPEHDIAGLAVRTQESGPLV